MSFLVYVNNRNETIIEEGVRHRDTRSTIQEAFNWTLERYKERTKNCQRYVRRKYQDKINIMIESHPEYLL